MRELLESPWRVVLGIVRPIEHPDRDDRNDPGDRGDHRLPWLLELDVDGAAMLWTNDADTGRTWKGPALNAYEAALVCAAAELDRMGPAHLRELRSALKRVTRPLTWERVAGEPVYEGMKRIVADHAREWTLGRVLTRLGVTLVRAAIVGGGSR